MIPPGVEPCPERNDGLPHEWAGAMATDDRNNPCRFCGTSGREHFQRVSAARAEFFSKLRQPKSVKAWGKS